MGPAASKFGKNKNEGFGSQRKRDVKEIDDEIESIENQIKHLSKRIEALLLEKAERIAFEKCRGEVEIEGEEVKMKKKRERPILDSDSVTEASERERKRKRHFDERGGEDVNLGTDTEIGKVEIEGEEGKMKKKRESHFLYSDSVTEASERKRKRGSDERGGEGEDVNLGTDTEMGEVEIEGEEGKMKKKRERPILDSDSVTEASERKRKRGSDERGGEREDVNLGTDTEMGEVEIKGEEGKMKKRKREELEKEWEKEKKYGMVVEGEEDEKEKFGNKTVGSKRKMIDNPADMFVLKEGFDDEVKLLRTIFVGNLPLKLKKKTLLKEFQKFGEVESVTVRIRSVPTQDTKKPRKGAIRSKKINDSANSVHAYIVFKTEESAQASLSHNMTVVEGNHIRVDRACPPRKKHEG